VPCREAGIGDLAREKLHHRSLHDGWVMVTGQAPDQLTWILGEKEVAAARAGG
jgi:hypothetical protein